MVGLFKRSLSNGNDPMLGYQPNDVPARWKVVDS